MFDKQEPKDIAIADKTINSPKRKIEQFLNSTLTCDQTKLSNQFDLSINLRRYTDTVENHDSCSVTVFIREKNSGRNLDSFFITPLLYFGDIFLNCESMTSYSTKYNSSREIVDNYFGDIVVADLNFDNKDDIAIINDNMGNGGPLYSYFIQTTNNKFTLDKFLTDSVTYFPKKIDKAKRRLITYVRAGAYSVGEHVYHLDKTNNEWKQTSHKYL